MQKIYYHATIRIEDGSRTSKGIALNLLPGMRVEAFIITGKRRLLDYIIYPFIRYMDEALRET